MKSNSKCHSKLFGMLTAYGVCAFTTFISLAPSCVSLNYTCGGVIAQRATTRTITINKFIVMMWVNTESRFRVYRVSNLRRQLAAEAAAAAAALAKQWLPAHENSSHVTWMGIREPQMKRLHYYFMTARARMQHIISAHYAPSALHSISLINNK